jgi:hypothetical protein
MGVPSVSAFNETAVRVSNYYRQASLKAVCVAVANRYQSKITIVPVRSGYQHLERVGVICSN